MSQSNITTRLKLAVTPFLAISLAIALIALYKSNTAISPHEAQTNHGVTNVGRVLSGETQQAPQPTTEHTKSTPEQHLSNVTVVILNDGRDRPLEFKMGSKLMKMPSPSSWPPIGSQSSNKGRYIAAIIDTADILKANGFKANDPFSLVVGDTELNVGNTFRIKGNDQPVASSDDDSPAVEYRTEAGEQGIWRTLKFKNLVVSHAQVPSLEDHLVAATSSARNTTFSDSASPGTGGAAPSTLPSAPTPRADIPQVTPLETPTPESTAKYVEALDSPDPAVRADAIENLLINGYREAVPNSDANAAMEKLISKSLLDRDSNVRSTTMEALDDYEGSLPQGTLSHIALNDNNPALRIQALDILVERFGAQAKATIQEAGNDPDPRVAKVARTMLNEVSGAP